MTLLAFGRRREIGVDVERMRRDLDVDAIARRFFSPEEQKQLTAVGSTERCEAFFSMLDAKRGLHQSQGARPLAAAESV
ncbi:hypothetical protein SBA1_1470010 [Candidatus Sulfotelmatobacter kueseliae]|uniref:4'-phosphopantetheinyl transferase domain-containing protein n=1 Tax=Candidatus Sulfotelmatobacter kueseliae TaxID=2042962 RepID=A0A2U3K8C9_9BACT|nr:hypothetical protein SBA1_1470010 [Candidatus Sulfotelmatobacter kueseliae]